MFDAVDADPCYKISGGGAARPGCGVRMISLVIFAYGGISMWSFLSQANMQAQGVVRRVPFLVSLRGPWEHLH